MHSVFKVYNIYLQACCNETTVQMNTQRNWLKDTILIVDCRILRIVEFDLKILDQYY